MALVLLGGLLLIGVLDAAPVMMRYPTTSARELAFVAHGDLWKAPRNGGRALRLVHSAGHALAARFSPDGRWIAYTERVAGVQDVYVVPAAGGSPRRLTFDARRKGDANVVAAWTPDSQRVVFLSDRAAWAYKVLQAFSIPLDGGLPERLPLEQSGFLSFAPDANMIAYTRTFTNFDARKRYTGGQAQDIFTYDLATRQLTRITDWKGTDTFPMWSGRRIYFLSDRGSNFRANLWCYDLDSHATRPVTRFGDYDVDWPSLGGDRITFQQGGRLWALELPGERLHEIIVDVPDDGARTAPRNLAVGRDARATDATGAVDYALSPHGEWILLAAHGDVFRMGLAHGDVRDLTATSAVDEDHPAASPDGRWIAYVTEDEHAQQLAVRSVDGGAERMLTHFATGVLYTPVFSPDGRWLALSDAEHELWLQPFAGDAARLIVRDPVAEIRDAAFSPDGRWLAFSTTRPTGLRALHLYDLKLGRDIPISSPLESDRLPGFSPDSNTLYFVSQRHELPFTSDRGDDASVSTLKSDGVYATSLRVESAADQEAALQLELPGLMSRAVALPVTPARIVSLDARGSSVIYETRPPSLIGGELPGEASALHVLDVPSGHDRMLLANLDGHVVSADGLHILYQRDGMWSVAHLDESGADTPIHVGGLELKVDPRAEWREMFEHAWRLDRDLFFSKIMNGTDWAHVHAAYIALLPRLGSRDDALYLLTQLQGELATSHAFIVGQDADDRTAPVRTARLGADLERDPESGRYRFSHVYQGDPTRERFRSPLNNPKTDGSGVKIERGQYLLAINGRDLRAPVDPDSLLAGLTEELTLTLAPSPDGPLREVQVRPLMSELNVRQYDWVESNRRRVSDLSDGRIGYVFMSDFEADGSEDLIRQLQGQLDKDGLVLDVRWNQGGFTSQAVLNLLRRRRAGGFINREGAIEPLPLFTAPPTMAAIANAQSASDGDQFPYFFRAFGLGPVVGQRTWGGVQGLKGLWPLMDGTGITIPKDSLATSDGRWLIENEGVTPDIEVDPEPDEAVTGRDRLLETAVADVLQRLDANPPSPPRVPAPLPAYPPAGSVPGANFSEPGAR
jgi:tricorn protease